MKNFNQYVRNNISKYKSLKILCFCLSAVFLIVGIILAAKKLSFGIYMVLWILCVVVYYVAHVMKSLEAMWGKMIQHCPECNSYNVSAHINHNYKDIRQYDKFTCGNCGHEWDNSKILNKINNKK